MLLISLLTPVCVHPSANIRVGMLVALTAMASMPVAAQTIEAFGANIQWGGGSHEFACTDWIINGNVVLGPGAQITGVNNLVIGPTGSLDLSLARIELAKSFSNQGQVVATGGSLIRVSRPTCLAEGDLGVIDPFLIEPQPEQPEPEQPEPEQPEPEQPEPEQPEPE